MNVVMHMLHVQTINITILIRTKYEIACRLNTVLFHIFTSCFTTSQNSYTTSWTI